MIMMNGHDPQPPAAEMVLLIVSRGNQPNLVIIFIKLQHLQDMVWTYNLGYVLGYVYLMVSNYVIAN